jgi:pimeloyl-ACP methyl ester carboxylesterase
MRVISEQPGQVSIHEYRMPDGTTRFQVFVDGTQEHGLDGFANVENAASTPRALQGSDARVAEAMEAAGIGPDDPVDMFGYSQGAAAVANVAATGRFNVESALLVAGPVASAELPPEVAVLSVAHEGDLVAATDGIADGDGPTPIPIESDEGHGTGALARHSRDEYIETLDTTDDSVVAHWREHMQSITAGASGIATHHVVLRRG